MHSRSCIHRCRYLAVLQSTITLTFVVSRCVTLFLGFWVLFSPVLLFVCVAVHCHTPIRSRSCFHPCLSLSELQPINITLPLLSHSFKILFSPLSVCVAVCCHTYAFQVLFSPLLQCGYVAVCYHTDIRVFTRVYRSLCVAVHGHTPIRSMSCFRPCCLQPVLQSNTVLPFVVLLLSLPSSECITVKFHIPMRSGSCFHPCLSFAVSVWRSIVTHPCVQ